jgi:hypothetical protein
VARARWSALLTAASVVSWAWASSACRPAELLAEQQDGALARGQLLVRRQEGQADALPEREELDGIGVRGQDGGVGHGLEPARGGQLDERRGEPAAGPRSIGRARRFRRPARRGRRGSRCA